MKKRFMIGGIVALVIMGLMSLAPLLANAESEWAKIQPASTESPSDISTLVLVNNEAVDRLLTGYRRGCKVRYATTATLTVEEGEVVCSNAGSTVRKFRSNTAEVTVTWANIDTGDEAASTTYYLYALADADATTFTISVSASNSAPTGATYYALIGTFYNNSSSNIDAAQINNVDSNNNQWVRAEDIEREIGFSAYRNAALNIADTTYTDIKCDTEDYDYGANYSTSTGRFTCDVAGRYLFTGAMRLSDLADGTLTNLAIYKNGAGYKQIGKEYVSSANRDPQINGSAIINLAAGDYVELFVYHNSGNTEAISNTSLRTYFQGIKIGR